MRIALAFVLLVACKGDKKAPPSAPASGSAPVAAVTVDAGAPPSQALVEGVKGLCALGDLNPAEAAAGMTDWIVKMQDAQNLEIADAYVKMMDGDEAALAKLRAAADVAVGPGKCNAALEAMARRGRERAERIAATPPPGPASQQLVDNMKFYCKGIEAMADMNPAVVQELTTLLAKDEHDKLRDAVKRAGLKDCPTLDATIAGKQGSPP